MKKKLTKEESEEILATFLKNCREQILDEMKDEEQSDSESEEDEERR